MPCATERAIRTACAEQHDASASFSESAHSSSVTAAASSPTSSAATAESTPPLIATSVRPEGATEARVRTATPSARCSASAARSAAWNLPGESPPSSSEIACAPTRAASSTWAPSTSVTTAEPAAVIVPQPEASKPAAVTRSPETASEIRIRSPQAAPPAVPSNASAGRLRRPAGCSRCSRKASTSVESRCGGLEGRAAAEQALAVELLVEPLADRRDRRLERPLGGEGIGEAGRRLDLGRVLRDHELTGSQVLRGRRLERLPLLRRLD